jgi:galacturan 1,4-alpha-galacturonidase
MKINALCGIILLPLCAFGLPENPSSINLITQHSNNELHSRACATGKDNWGNCVEADRIPTTIRASTSETDDVSTAFLEGLKKANDGGLLHLEKGKKYIIAKKLDLSFLNNVYVKLDGEIKFTNDIKYWQANNFYHPFQKSISFWVWGGKDIKIYGSGTMNGNGQAWYDGFAGKEILVCFHLFCVIIVLMSSNLG